MADMVVGIPANVERIEREARFLRRNSTGSFGLQINKSKVLSRYLSNPKGSCHDACKGAERDDQTKKARTSLLSRTVAASEKIPELATTMQVQRRKKSLRSCKLPVNLKRRTTCKAQRTSLPNKGSRVNKNTGSSKLGNKKAVGKPANLEQIEHELSNLRRNSTGNLGIEMGASKVLSRHVSVPTGSSDASKDGAECNCKTKVRTRMSTTSANFRRLKTSHGKEMRACTKKLAVSASHQSDLKLKPLEENDYSVSRNNKLSRRRYSESLITGGLPTLQGSILDDAITKTNSETRIDKDTASYELSKKWDVHKPANLDKIDSGVGYLRRNSTGSLAIEMGESKVSTGSRQDVRKYTVESDLQKKSRILPRTRPVAASGEIPEMAAIVKLQIRKKPLSSSELPNIKSPESFRTQLKKIPASTKIAAEKGSSGLSKKKDAITISHSTRTSVKRVLVKKLNNNSPRMVSQRNKQISLPSKTGKVIHEDDSDKVSPINNLTSLARTKKMQPSHENFPNKASQLRKWTSLKGGKMELGSHRSVPKGTLYARESKTKSQIIQTSRENRQARVSSLDRHGPIRGKKPSPLLSSSSSLHSAGSSSRNLGNRKSSLSSTSACESVNGDAIVSSSKKSGTTSPNQDIKGGKAAICSPKNLKFRRGKIIDFQSEKLSPRRLKFRPPKILENNGNGSAHARGRSTRRFIAYGKSNAAKDESMKVNLRHQSRRDKKEAPILFNNVIEETATKLEETRRSKVKALVGAFETVISLQDPASSQPIICR